VRRSAPKAGSYANAASTDEVGASVEAKIVVIEARRMTNFI
jgi:hypothetical protein